MNWTGLAVTRTLSVLRTRHLACLRTLEAKISEAGPEGIRPEPIYLTAARRALLISGKIIAYRPSAAISVPHPIPPGIEFYHLPVYNPSSQENVPLVRRIISAYTVFHHAATAGPRLCGRVLEDFIYHAANQAKNIDTFGNPDDPLMTFQGCHVFQDRPLDLIIRENTHGLYLGIEEKNRREWVYPEDPELWDLIAKATSLNIIPLLVARKLSYLTRRFCQQVGILFHETHTQYFHPSLEASFADVLHKEAVGFKDIRFHAVCPPRHIRFFQSYLPSPYGLPQYAVRFAAVRGALRRYAIDERLYDENLSGPDRRRTYYRLAEELGLEK